MLQYHSIIDEIIPYTQGTTLRDAWCARGAEVRWFDLFLGEHALGIFQGQTDTINFLNDRFTGVPVPAHLQRLTGLVGRGGGPRRRPPRPHVPSPLGCPIATSFAGSNGGTAPPGVGGRAARGGSTRRHGDEGVAATSDRQPDP